MEPIIIDDKSSDLNEPRENGKDFKNPLSILSQNWKFNVVDNLEAPELYSRKAIYFFTVLCSVFFGGTLMFINLRKLKNRQGQIVVAIYSILYGVITLAILNQFERNTILTLVVSMIGSFALYNFFWEKYIGIKTEYRAKSIWVPLVISLILLAIFTNAILTNIEEFK